MRILTHLVLLSIFHPYNYRLCFVFLHNLIYFLYGQSPLVDSAELAVLLFNFFLVENLLVASQHPVYKFKLNL